MLFCAFRELLGGFVELLGDPGSSFVSSESSLVDPESSLVDSNRFSTAGWADLFIGTWLTSSTYTNKPSCCTVYLLC